MGTALAGLAVALAMRPERSRARPVADRRPTWRDLLPVAIGVALLLAPALFWVTAPDPVAAAPARAER